ncbi:MAG: CoA transferase [Myxococcota bacterium]
MSLPPRTASGRPVPPVEGPDGAPLHADERIDAAAQGQRLLAACGLPAGFVDASRSADPPAVDWARSGAMALTGDAAGEPRACAGPLATAMRSAGLALAWLAPDAGFEAFDAAALLGERAAIAGLARAGRTSAGGRARLLPTADGWIALHLPRVEDWALVPAWLEGPASLAREDWNDLARRVVTRASEPIVARARLMGLAVASAPTAPLADRPLLRLHHASAVPPRSATRGLRVLDLSALWAGPLAGSLLAQAGLDVLKLESPGRPDGARAGPRVLRSAERGQEGLRARPPLASRPRPLRRPARRGGRRDRECPVPMRSKGWASPPRRWVAPSRTPLDLDHGLWTRPRVDSPSATTRRSAQASAFHRRRAGTRAGRPTRRKDGSAEPCFCGDAIADPLRVSTPRCSPSVICARAAADCSSSRWSI